MWEKPRKEVSNPASYLYNQTKDPIYNLEANYPVGMVNQSNMNILVFCNSLNVSRKPSKDISGKASILNTKDPYGSTKTQTIYVET
jgi:hypothetical protein